MFLFADQFITSHNLISWQYMDMVKRKLMLVTIGKLRVEESISLRNQHRFPCKVMSKEWGWELPINHTSLPSASDWLKICASSSQNYYLDVGSDTSSVWNFCAHSLDIILLGNQRWCCKSQFFLRLGLILIIFWWQPSYGHLFWPNKHLMMGSYY